MYKLIKYKGVININPVFWLLVIIIAIVAWFIISPIFTILGRMAFKKWDKTEEILNKEDKYFNEEKGEEKDE